MKRVLLFALILGIFYLVMNNDADSRPKRTKRVRENYDSLLIKDSTNKGDKSICTIKLFEGLVLQGIIEKQTKDTIYLKQKSGISKAIFKDDIEDIKLNVLVPSKEEPLKDSSKVNPNYYGIILGTGSYLFHVGGFYALPSPRFNIQAKYLFHIGSYNSSSSPDMQYMGDGRLTAGLRANTEVMHLTVNAGIGFESGYYKGEPFTNFTVPIEIMILFKRKSTALGLMFFSNLSINTHYGISFVGTSGIYK